MSCSNPPLNFSRKPRISIRQVWRRTTPTPKSPPPSQNALPSPSPPTNNPHREQRVNQLHQISQLLEANLHHATNAYSQVPPSPRSPSPTLIHPATLNQVNFHSGFCHFEYLNGGNSKLVEKEVNSDVVSSIHGTSFEAFDQTRAWEGLKSHVRLLLNLKVAAGAGNTFAKKVDDPVNADSNSEVDEVFNEMQVLSSPKVNKSSKSESGMGNKSLYEKWKVTYNEDLYDDDDCGLTDAHMKFANAFDINLCGQLR
ncbi:hypothetical protein Tco_1541082 [Tanacetum coccineum]